METGRGNNFWTKTDGKAIPTASPTFSTMPNLDMALPTWSDIIRHRKLKCRPRNRKWKPEMEITFEQKQMVKRFQWLPPHFRPCPTRIWHRPHCPTSADVGNALVGHETGSGNRKWKNFWTVTDGEAIPTATPIFATMPELDISPPTFADFDRHPELRMSGTKPDVEIVFEQKEMSTRF